MTDTKGVSPKPKEDFVYAAKAQTNIILELASKDNPYVAKANFLQGYNVLELMQKNL